MQTSSTKCDESPPDSKQPFLVNSPTLGREIKIFMERHRENVASMIEAGGDEAGSKASQLWARSFDGLLCSLFCAIRSSTGDEKTWKNMSLAAVGSYGRLNFSYRSDLDVRILCTKPKKAAEIAEALLYPLWDAGLEIGHQVITVTDTIALAKKDLPTATTLLDWRHLAGDEEAGRKLKEKAFETIFSTSNVYDFLHEMADQAEQRAERFGDSVYLLEPDLKNGQGGVRDLDIVNWTAQARWRARNTSDLVQIGILAPEEHQALEDASAFLARVRNIIHIKSPRRTDRLSFDGQEVVAETMGYGQGGAAVEEMMSEYYRHARSVANIRESLLLRAEPPAKKQATPVDLGDGIVMQGESVAIANLDDLRDQPVLALRAYWEAVHRSAPVCQVTRQAIARTMADEAVCEKLRADEEAATLFRRLLRKPRKVKFKRNSTLSEFHDVGILLALIPEFQPVVGRVHNDIYHVYTVDVHSIAAVDRLRKYCRGEMSEEHAIASRLAADIARPQVLFMAALLHDIGKGEGGRDHSIIGAKQVAPILARLGVKEHDIVEIQHLIEKHLRMYHVASRRDIDDPDTISAFRDEVNGPEGLKELYLLTLCDVATTSPTALTSWKTRMMEELYLATRHSFEGLAPHDDSRAEKIREAARKMCPEKGEAEFLSHFLDSVPNRYLYANEPTQIVGHGRLARMSEGRRILVEMIGTRSPYVELGFIVDDKPGALEMITASLAANKMRVAGAQLYFWTDRNGRKRVLDIFWVRCGREPEVVQRQIPRLRQDLEALVSGETTPLKLFGSRKSKGLSDRPTPDVPTMINFDNRSSSRHTVIEVLAEDRHGLLFRLAKTLNEAKLEVAVAKINTEGNGVADVFYVADREGNKLLDPAQVEALNRGLREAVQKAGKGL